MGEQKTFSKPTKVVESGVFFVKEIRRLYHETHRITAINVVVCRI